jgi:rod shape-determining protein MreD
MRVREVTLLVVLVYVAAVAETALVDLMRIGSVTPDLLALLAVVWLIAADRPRAFLVGGAVMLVGDLISPGRVGLGAAWMLLVGFGVGRLHARVRLDNLAVRLAVVLVAVSVWAAGVGLVGRLAGDVALAWTTVFARAGGVGLYTAAVSLPVLMVLGWSREPALSRAKRLDSA